MVAVVTAGDALPDQLPSRPEFQPVPRQTAQFTGKHYTMRDVDVKPRVLQPQVAPVTPPALKLYGVSGDVLMAFIVDEKGVPEQTQAISATHAGFVDAAKKAIEQWRFEPATRGGAPVKCVVHAPVRFDPGKNKDAKQKKRPSGKEFQLVAERESNFKGEYLLLQDVDTQPRTIGMRAAPMFPFALKQKK